jgi:hypothetical protein
MKQKKQKNLNQHAAATWKQAQTLNLKFGLSVKLVKLTAVNSAKPNVMKTIKLAKKTTQTFIVIVVPPAIANL